LLPTIEPDHRSGSDGAEHSLQPAREAEVPEAGAIGARSILWPLLLSLLAFAGVAYFTFDLEAFVELLPRLNAWLLAAAVGTVLVRVAFGGWRLRYFARGQLGLKAGVRSQIAWDFFAYVTPSTVGGGPFVSLFISRDQKLPLGDASSIILFAMLLDQIILALTIPVLLLLTPFYDVFPAALGTVGTWTFMLFFLGYMTWVLLFAYSTLVRPELLTRLLGSIFRIRPLRRFKSRAFRVLSNMRQRSATLRKQPARFYASGLLLTLIPWLSRYALAVFVIWSLLPTADGLLIFLRAAALNLGTLALPTPGGAGGAEGLYLLFFGPDLMPRPFVAPTLLVWRTLSYYIFIIAGIFVTLRFLQIRGTTSRSRTNPERG